MCRGEKNAFCNLHGYLRCHGSRGDIYGVDLMVKTNAERMLEKAKIPFCAFDYEYDENDLSGVHAAENLGISPCEFFKTLVLKGTKNGYFVCCIPVDRELDLKKAAAVFSDKSAEMLHVKDLQGITGYVRGGCTPIGMKKQFAVFFDKSIGDLECVFISGGTRGLAIKVNKNDLIPFVKGKVADIVKD